MNKYFLFFIGALSYLSAYPQSINFTNNGVSYNFPAATAGEMLFNGAEVSIGDNHFDLNIWSSISVADESLENNTVKVSFDNETAHVTIAGNLASYVEASVEGAHVTIVQSDLVSADTCGEISYLLSGSSANGSLTLSGSYKSTIELLGLSLTNLSGAALDIKNGKRISLSAKSGTLNSLSDGNGSQKGAISCTGHLELKGKGSLTVKGNKSHAIYAKEYVEIKNLNLEITGAVKDGINCAQYFLMESGNVSISGTGDDGIQTGFKDDTDREPEDTGSITINGGTINMLITADAVKCLKADADITITGGTLNLQSDANGIWDSSKMKTKASACLGADGDVIISGGEINLKATGSGGKGISCDGVFRSEGGKTTVATTGGLLVYSNNSLNHNYTSNAERINSDYKSSAKGIKADSGVIINDGEFHITTASNNAEGIESKTTLEINGGKIFVKAYDDGINSSNDFKVTGGELTVISIVGDGLDSNGNLTISGGRVITMGSGGMEMGLDAATESGCAVYITGGTLLAFGGSNTYPTKSGSTQAFVKVSGSVTANTEVSVKSGSDILASFIIPEEYNSSTGNPMFGPGNGPGGGGWRPGGESGSGSILISCPDLANGQTYTVTNNTTSTAVSALLTYSGR